MVGRAVIEEAGVERMAVMLVVVLVAAGQHLAMIKLERRVAALESGEAMMTQLPWLNMHTHSDGEATAMAKWAGCEVTQLRTMPGASGPDSVQVGAHVIEGVCY